MQFETAPGAPQEGLWVPAGGLRGEGVAFGLRSRRQLIVRTAVGFARIQSIQHRVAGLLGLRKVSTGDSPILIARLFECSPRHDAK